MVTGQAQQLGFSPDVFYVCIGGVFPGYRDQFGAEKVEGIFAYGGQDHPRARATKTTPKR